MADPKEGAIIKKGHEEGLKMWVSLLEEFEFPLGILPVEDVTEVGYVKSTGYLWIMQKKKVEHCFKTIKQYVRYDTEITGYLEKKKFTKFTGVKGKEFMLWLSVSDVSVDEPTPGKIQFTSQLAGITRSFPKEAFVPAQPVAQPEATPVVQPEAKPVA